MPDKVEAEKAIKDIDGFSINGRVLTVKVAENKKPTSINSGGEFRPRSMVEDPAGKEITIEFIFPVLLRLNALKAYTSMCVLEHLFNFLKI